MSRARVPDANTVSIFVTSFSGTFSTTNHFATRKGRCCVSLLVFWSLRFRRSPLRSEEMATRFMLASAGGRSGICRASASSKVDEVECRVGVGGGETAYAASKRSSILGLTGRKRRFDTLSRQYKTKSTSLALTRTSLGSRIGSAMRRRLQMAWPLRRIKAGSAEKVSWRDQAGGGSAISEVAISALLAAGTAASLVSNRGSTTATEAGMPSRASPEPLATSAAATGQTSDMVKFGEGGSDSRQPSVKSSVNALNGARVRSDKTEVPPTKKVKGLRKYGRLATRKTRRRPAEASVSFDGAYKASVGALMGNKPCMEDAYYVGDGGRFVAVFDGHGGADVASFLQNRLHKCFVKNLSREQDKKDGAALSVESCVSALSGAFQQVDQAVMKVDALQYQGSTACAVVVHEEKNGQKTLLSANVGDSRAIVSRKGRAINLTRDHKPNDEIELKRITSMGEKVTFDRHGQVYRVRNLALARSIGDRFAKPVVSGEAEVTDFSVSNDDEFVIIASDGLWDVMTSQEVVNFVHKNLRVAGKKRKEEVRKQLTDLVADEALRRGSDDNICVALVWLK